VILVNSDVERTEVTVEWLREHGRIAEPCDCGEQMCAAWQMGRVLPSGHVCELEVKYVIQPLSNP